MVLYDLKKEAISGLVDNFMEFPTPKEGPSLDEMIRNYGIFVIEFSAKPLNNKQRLKKKNERE